MHKVAVLLDGGHVLHEIRKMRGYSHYHLPRHDEIEELAHRCYDPDEEQLFRIYYYDCEPFGGKARHPIDNHQIDFGGGQTFILRNEFYSKLAQTRNFAFRAGQLKFRGWGVKNNSLRRLISCSGTLNSDDLKPQFQQKGVDIKIGLDISWLASKRIVERIILFTGDTDFIPAMKFARREGVQVVLASLRETVNSGLREHSDEFRLIKLPSAPAVH